MRRVTITIGREYGSGGHEVGEKLAERLGFTFLDRIILNEISRKSGISVEDLMNHTEAKTPSFRDTLIPYDFESENLNEKLFDMQADFRLYHLGDRQKAAKMIRKTEKIRRNYYQYYTDEVWGDKRNKALMINTSQTGVDGAVELIIAYLKLKGYLDEDAGEKQEENGGQQEL